MRRLLTRKELAVNQKKGQQCPTRENHAKLTPVMTSASILQWNVNGVQS